MAKADARASAPQKGSLSADLIELAPLAHEGVLVLASGSATHCVSRSIAVDSTRSGPS